MMHLPKAANVGVAMGHTGTDVARADIVVEDDSQTMMCRQSGTNHL